jgi:hypothetical protein
MADQGHNKTYKYPKQIDASAPLEYDGDPILTPGSNQLATMKEIHPALAPINDFVDFTASEPAAPSVGDRYINTATGVSSITTQSVTATYVYEWNGTNWTETVPSAGDMVYDTTSQKFYIYSGTAWIADHETLNQLQTYYIGKAGNDSNSGLSENDPVLTIKQAIILADAQTPDSANRFRLRIIGGGVYDIGADNLVLSSYLYLTGEAATLNATTGSLNLRDQSMLVIGNVTRSGAGYIIQKTTGAGDAYVTILGDTHTNTYGFINLDNGSLHVNFKRAFTLGTDDPSFIQVIGGNLFLTGSYLNNTVATGYTLRAQGSGRIYANVSNILATDKWLELAGTSHAYIHADITSGTKTLGGTTTYDIREGATRTRSSGITVVAAAGDITHTLTSPGLFKLNGNQLATGEVMGRGDIYGFDIEYSTTTAVNITLGACEANGVFYSKSSATSHSMTSLAAGFDIHYIYIDHSASTSPTPVFIDSITEPSYSTTKRGWYNGDDRCIGGIISRAGTATVDYFSVALQSGHVVRVHYGRASTLGLAANMNPTSAWQTPNQNESSVTIPVMATAVKLWLSNTDSGGVVLLVATSSEMAAVNTAVPDGDIYSVAGTELTLNEGWVNLGASRNIKIGGANDDDNVLSAWVTGFEIQR